MTVSYEMFMAMIGFGVLSAAIAPSVARRFGIRLGMSLPIACLGGGILMGLLLDMPRLDVIAHGPVIQRVTEAAVILSLTGCGLKLDRSLGLRSWSTTWRLLGITMPLSIAMMLVGGWLLLDLPAAVALLLAAALAPTDPVLAASVQVGPPGEAEESVARFALTSEAGLNDGLAFPFVHLALAAAAAYAGATGDVGRFSDHVISGWLAFDVAWKLAAGVAMGWAVGAGLGRLVFRVAPRRGVGDSFLALGLTLFSYGVTEAVHGYGFLAVFIAAVSFRRSESQHGIHVELHRFVDQTETLLMIGVVYVTGIALAQGVLAPIGWQGLLLSALFLGLFRPLSGWLALAGAGLTRAERWTVSILGIRGVGTFYYLSYGLTHAPFSIEAGRQMWAIAGLIVAVSVVLHGLTAPHLMQRLNRP